MKITRQEKRVAITRTATLFRGIYVYLVLLLHFLKVYVGYVVVAAVVAV